MQQLIDLGDWSLIPGPLVDPPPSSLTLDDIVEYPPELVAEAILAMPGMRLIQPAATWWDWRAAWQQDERSIQVDFTLFDIEPPAWGGSGLAGKCDLDDLRRLWETVRKRAPACWFHNASCEIHSWESFAMLHSSTGFNTP